MRISGLLSEETITVSLSHIASVSVLPACIRKRNIISRLRKVTDRQIREKMYSGSIVFDYFVRGKKTAASLYT